MIRRLCWAACSFSAAVFAAVYLLPEGVLLPAGLCAALASLLCLFFHGKNRKRVALAALGIAAGLLWTACYGTLFRAPAHALATDENGVEAILTVVEYPEETQYGSSFTARIHTGGWYWPKVHVYASADGLELLPGDEISLSLRLAPSHEVRGERVTYYEAKGVYLFGYANEKISLLRRPEHVSPLLWPVLSAKAVKDSIANIFPADVLGFQIALITGDKEQLPAGLYAAFQRSGIAHAVAVSGLHISFLAGMLAMLLGKRSKLSILLGLFLVFFFAAATGNSPSALRAAIMAGFILLAPLVGREDDKPTTLSAALLLLLFGCPYAAASVSLQLSFAAVAGIYLVSEPVSDWLMDRIPERSAGIPGKLRTCLILGANSLAVSLGALIFTTPLIAVYFHSVSLVSPLTNLLTLWAISIAFVGGLLCAVIGLGLPAVGAILAWVVAWPARLVIWTARAISSWPFSSVGLLSGYMLGWFVLAYSLVLVWTFFHRYIRLRVVAGAVCVTLILSLVFQTNSILTGALTVAALDVGQGASTLLCSRGRAVLVDCGGNGTENAGDTAANYMQSMGISKLDALILTHYHADHANGVPELLARLNVDLLVLPDVTPEEPLRREIIVLAEKYGCNVQFLSTYDVQMTFGDAEAQIFAPLGNGNANEVGLSVLCTTGTFDVLITGDMSGSMEKELISERELPDIELLMVGHHGSRSSTSAELLRATRPEQAVISVGRNSYGHPSDATLQRLTAAGCDIYRTDWMGTVVFSFDMPLQDTISSENTP